MVPSSQPSRVWGPLPCDHRELNFANNHVALKGPPILRWGHSPADTLNTVC